jgi:hypothetical protein
MRTLSDLNAEIAEIAEFGMRFDGRRAGRRITTLLCTIFALPWSVRELNALTQKIVGAALEVHREGVRSACCSIFTRAISHGTD